MLRDLPFAGDMTMTGPLLAGRNVLPQRPLGNSTTRRCDLLPHLFHCPELGDTVGMGLNPLTRIKIQQREQRRQTLT